jgi:hypothetical protein
MPGRDGGLCRYSRAGPWRGYRSDAHAQSRSIGRGRAHLPADALRCADAVSALLILLNLLKRGAQQFTEALLGHVERVPAFPYPSADMLRITTKRC